MILEGEREGEVIHLSGVESVDTMIPCRLQALLDDVAFLRPAVSEPAAEGEERDFESGWPKVTEYLCS